MKLIAKTNIYGEAGKIIVEAGSVVDVPDDTQVDTHAYQRFDVKSEPEPESPKKKAR